MGWSAGANTLGSAMAMETANMMAGAVVGIDPAPQNPAKGWLVFSEQQARGPKVRHNKKVRQNK
jgi:hypothetical protein